jgi:hypothetical protein
MITFILVLSLKLIFHPENQEWGLNKVTIIIFLLFKVSLISRGAIGSRRLIKYFLNDQNSEKNRRRIRNVRAQHKSLLLLQMRPNHSCCCHVSTSFSNVVRYPLMIIVVVAVVVVVREFVKGLQKMFCKSSKI